ncbi:Major histocompatibility complex class I-related gene protein [Merluccius polli]|uniref:Major histocompatibility complex class I-related gene protein n=1 Tax=Merluccius polli TaxID=89951 RepID=A0AA47M146_MERPO|nr:Major histocompatibility complex class I-related gene protein [Merluccius polli]
MRFRLCPAPKDGWIVSRMKRNCASIQVSQASGCDDANMVMKLTANVSTTKYNYSSYGRVTGIHAHARVHTYQFMSGCEWDDEDNATDGYSRYGYDGEDHLALDMKTWTWVVLPQQVKLDEGIALKHYLKYYFTKECISWLKKFLAYGRSTLQRIGRGILAAPKLSRDNVTSREDERPEVSLLQRSPSSPVVCHATGFYPERVVVFWRRDGEELYEHVDHGEVLPNPDGTYQVSVDLDLASVPKEDWRRYECVIQLKGIEDISILLDPALVRTNWGKTGPGRDGGVKSEITTPIIIVCVVLLLAAVAAGVVVYKKRKRSSGTTEEQSPAPEAQPLTTKSMKALIGLLLLAGCHGVSSEIYSLKYTLTASSGVSNIPEFVAVATLNELQIGCYDSNSQKIELNHSWMDQWARDYPDYLKDLTSRAQGYYHGMKANVESLKKHLNQTGVHTYQFMSSCEWDDEDNATDCYGRFGYDGEDSLALDIKTWTWVVLPQQVKLDEGIALKHHLKYYFTKECISWLKMFLAYGRSTLQRTGRVT